MKLQHVTPESVGVPSQAVLDLLDEFYRQGVEMHGLMLLRHGQVYAEGHWAPYNAQNAPHPLFFQQEPDLYRPWLRRAGGHPLLGGQAGGPVPRQSAGEPQRKPASLLRAGFADDGLRPRQGN